MKALKAFNVVDPGPFNNVPPFLIAVLTFLPFVVNVGFPDSLLSIADFLSSISA